MSQMNQDPKLIFGEDLIKVFGPKANRKHILSLTYTEKMEIVNSVPNYVSTDALGKTPTLFEIANLILTKMMQSGKFQGIDLDWFEADGLIEHGLKRPVEMFINVERIGKNNRTQRGIKLRHLIKDILFNFNPKKVLSGLARYSKARDFWYLNDAQHRTIACVILGIRLIPLEYEESEFESIDVEQYSCVNIYSLPASNFDIYRNLVQMMRVCHDEGRDTTNLEPMYHNAWGVHTIVEQENGIKMVEESAGKMECSNTGNMMREYDDYGEDVFRRAVAIVGQSMSNTSISQQNVHMVCEFIRMQNEAGIDAGGEIFMDMAIAGAFQHWCPKGDRSGLYIEGQRAVNASAGKDEFTGGATKNGRTNLQKWVAGLVKLIRVTNPEVDWAPVIVKGTDVASEWMSEFRVMPKA